MCFRLARHTGFKPVEDVYLSQVYLIVKEVKNKRLSSQIENMHCMEKYLQRRIKISKRNKAECI